MANSPALKPGIIRTRALQALRSAFQRTSPEEELDGRGYVPRFTENLLPGVRTEDFEADLRHGDGNELQGKFRAVHSSSALAVNAFAPFRSRLPQLVLPGSGPFSRLEFERKCPNGLRGNSPNLDVLLEGTEEVVGIESKLAEPMTATRAKFSSQYRERLRDRLGSTAWFLEMCRLEDDPNRYGVLDAAQLVKHAFGLIHTFPDRNVKLLYLFWEPRNSRDHPFFAEHRRQVAEFARSVQDSSPAFDAMSHGDLWRHWSAAASPWLSAHIRNLQARYEINL